MGIPAITNSGVGDVADIVEKYDSGIVIKNLSKENYINYSEVLSTANFDSDKIRDGAKEFLFFRKCCKKIFESI